MQAKKKQRRGAARVPRMCARGRPDWVPRRLSWHRTSMDPRAPAPAHSAKISKTAKPIHASIHALFQGQARDRWWRSRLHTAEYSNLLCVALSFPFIAPRPSSLARKQRPDTPSRSDREQRSARMTRRAEAEARVTSDECWRLGPTCLVRCDSEANVGGW
jgi:hypothetical protein